MPDFMWIVIAVAAGTLFIVLLILLIQGKLKVQTDGKHFSAVVVSQEVMKNNPEFNERISCMDDKLRNIEDDLLQLYRYTMVHEIGVEESYVSNNQDYVHFRECVKNAIWSKNGKRSMKTIIEDALISGEYRCQSVDPEEARREKEVFLYHFMEKAQNVIQSYLDKSYLTRVDTFVIGADGARTTGYRERVISREFLARLIRGINLSLKNDVADIFYRGSTGCGDTE